MSVTPSIYSDPQINQSAAVGSEDVLSTAHLGPVDHQHVDDENSLFTPHSSKVAARNYWFTWVDIGASRTRARWGEPLSVSVKSNKLAMLQRVSVHMKLPALDPSYNLRYIDWAAEAILGSNIRLEYGSSGSVPLKQLAADTLHVRRRVQAKTAMPEDAQYKANVGADLSYAESTSGPVYLEIDFPLHLDGSLDGMSPICGHTEGLQLMMDIPQLTSLVRRAERGAVLDTAACASQATLENFANSDANQPEISFRLHGPVTEQAERAALALSVLKGNGFKWDVLTEEAHVNMKAPVPTTVTSPEDTFETVNDITNIKRPCQLLVVGSRYAADTRNCVFGAARTDAVVTAVGDSGFGVQVVEPRRFQFQPIVSVELTEQEQRALPTYNSKIVEGEVLCRYVPLDFNSNLVVIPFSVHPLQERHAAGHKTLTNFNLPKIKVTEQARPGYTAAGVPTVYESYDPWSRSSRAPGSANTYTGASFNTAVQTGCFDRVHGFYALVRSTIISAEGEEYQQYR
jgi:hypothetical protein